MSGLLLSLKFVVSTCRIPKSISRLNLQQFHTEWEKVLTEEACTWRPAETPQEVTAGTLFGRKELLGGCWSKRVTTWPSLGCRPTLPKAPAEDWSCHCPVSRVRRSTPLVALQPQWPGPGGCFAPGVAGVEEGRGGLFRRLVFVGASHMPFGKCQCPACGIFLSFVNHHYHYCYLL